MLRTERNDLLILPASFVLANSMRSEEQNQGRVFLSVPKGSLYFVRNGAYLVATQEKESHFCQTLYIGVPASVGRRTIIDKLENYDRAHLGFSIKLFEEIIKLAKSRK